MIYVAFGNSGWLLWQLCLLIGSNFKYQKTFISWKSKMATTTWQSLNLWKEYFFKYSVKPQNHFECRLGWNVPWMVCYKNPRGSSSQNIVLTYNFSNKTRSVIESKLYMKNHWMVLNKKINFYENWKSIMTANRRQYLT